VAAGLAGPGGAAEPPARPAEDVPVAGAVEGGQVAGRAAAGRALEPLPGGGMSRTLPVLGNSYGIVLATAG